MGRAGLFALTAMLVLAACGRKKPAPVEAPLVTVGREDLVVATPGSVSTGPTISGRLFAVRTANLRAEVQGLVESTLAAEGERVFQGQLLARINPAASPNAMRAADLAARAARDALVQARIDEARTRRLWERGAASRQEYERALSVSRQARTALAQADAQAAAAAETLQRTQIWAPFSGVISARQVSPGDIVQPGAPLYQLVDPSLLRLEAAVPVQDLASVRVGTRVRFSVSGFGERGFEGEVVQVNPVVDPTTGQARVYLNIPNPDLALMSGLYAQGQLEAQSAEGVVVPLSAVDTGATPANVALIDKGLIRHAPVKVLLSDTSTDRAVVQGLAAGTQIVIGGSRDLPDGTRVKTPASTAPNAQGQARRAPPRQPGR